MVLEEAEEDEGAGVGSAVEGSLLPGGESGNEASDPCGELSCAPPPPPPPPVVVVVTEAVVVESDPLSKSSKT